jgi:hypothetical protein
VPEPAPPPAGGPRRSSAGGPATPSARAGASAAPCRRSTPELCPRRPRSPVAPASPPPEPELRRPCRRSTPELCRSTRRPRSPVAPASPSLAPEPGAAVVGPTCQRVVPAQILEDSVLTLHERLWTFPRFCSGPRRSSGSGPPPPTEGAAAGNFCSLFREQRRTLCMKEIRSEGFFTKWWTTARVSLPRRTDRWDRPVRKRVNTAKSRNQCYPSRTDPNGGS